MTSDLQASQGLGKRGFLLERGVNKVRKNGMKGWHDGIVDERRFHPEASLFPGKGLKEGLCVLSAEVSQVSGGCGKERILISIWFISILCLLISESSSSAHHL